MQSRVKKGEYSALLCIWSGYSC